MKTKYDTVCFVTTIYALFLYLLHSDLNKINNTLFIFSDTFPKVVGIRLPSHLFLKDIINKSNKIVYFFYNHPKIAWVYYRYIRCKLFRKVNRKYKLYAQDHLYFSSTIIGDHDYTLIEDCKGFFSQSFIKNRPLKMKSKLYDFLYGDSEGRSIGRNRRCTELLSTSADVAVELRNKRNIICEIREEWDVASDEKKSFIRNVFNVKEEDLEKLKSYEIVLYTQPLYFYSVISKDEQIELYKKVIDNYPGNRILIKPHPIDEIEYEKFVDNIKVWKNDIPVPSQLLSLCGITFKKYVTLFSMAVTDLEKDADIDWYGTEIDDKILRGFGKVPVPKGVHLRKL